MTDQRHIWAIETTASELDSSAQYSPEDSEHRVRAAEDIRAVADTLRALTERHAWDD